jgi:MFS family permease
VPALGSRTLTTDRYRRWRHVAGRVFRSLQGRNYRLYFAAQVVSSTGIWLQLVAENWLVLRLTHSGLALGVTTALQFTPLLVLGAYGGVVVDRVNKRNLLVGTQLAAGSLALATGLLTLTGTIRVWIVWLAALLLGCVSCLDNPARQAFTWELVGPPDIANAVALNNGVATVARALGPALAGLLIGSVGVAPCFLLNAASYVADVAALVAIRTTALSAEASVARAPRQVREGLRHVWRTPSLRIVLIVLALASSLGMNFQVLLPLLASETFHRGGGTFGLLMSAMGAGALAGSLLVASWSDPSIRRVSFLSILFGASLAALAAAPSLAFAFAAVSVLGISFSLFLASCSSSLQLNAGDQMRGRVMALHTIVFLGSAPIGGPLVGYIAQLLGARAGFLVGAGACAAAGALGLLLWEQQD